MCPANFCRRDRAAGQLRPALHPDQTSKTPAAGLHEPVHFVQQGRYFLDLVQDHPPTGGQFPDHGLQAVRVAGEFQKESGIEQIEPHGIGQHLLEPRALSRSPGAEEEERPFGTAQKTRDG